VPGDAVDICSVPTFASCSIARCYRSLSAFATAQAMVGAVP
jgi:hypothetical protein